MVAWQNRICQPVPMAGTAAGTEMGLTKKKEENVLRLVCIGLSWQTGAGGLLAGVQESGRRQQFLQARVVSDARRALRGATTFVPEQCWRNRPPRKTSTRSKWSRGLQARRRRQPRPRRRPPPRRRGRQPRHRLPPCRRRQGRGDQQWSQGCRKDTCRRVHRCSGSPAGCWRHG